MSSRSSRRRYSAEYKQQILKEAEGCTARGALGALLRREGLYSSHLTEWRKAAEQGQAAALTPKKRGPKAKEVDGRARELAAKDREIAELKKRLERAELMLEIQKKFSELTGIALPPPPSDDEDA